MASTRLASISTTETLLDETISVLQEEPTASEAYTPLGSVQKFSRRDMTKLAAVLSAAHLPAAVVMYDGSSYQNGRAPVRTARIGVVVRWSSRGNPEEQAVLARAQLDATIQRLDEHVQSGTGTTAVWYVTADGVAEGKDGSINYYAFFEAHDH